MHREKTEKYSENKIKITIDINILRMMVGKQWATSRHMYRWGGEASIQVKEASRNKGYEAESNAFYHNISLQKHLARPDLSYLLKTSLWYCHIKVILLC